MLQNIRIVLVETSHTGNMGSVARAMKTMGLTNLWLVNPLVKPDSQAIALAAGASDVIGNAQIVDTLDEALAGCSLVVGTSARSRTLPWPMLDPRECGLKSVSEAEQAPVALVFGRERVGLTNDELQKCHYHVAIAANPEYSSLNLAMAVQVIAYEWRKACAVVCLLAFQVLVSGATISAALRIPLRRTFTNAGARLVCSPAIAVYMAANLIVCRGPMMMSPVMWCASSRN